MKITMDMGSYEIEASETEYGDEILYAGWNPEVEIASQQLHQVQTTEQMAISTMSAALEMEVVELFLRKMYSYQR